MVLVSIAYRELETLIVERATEVDPKGVCCPEIAADIQAAAVPPALAVVSPALVYRRFGRGP